ncbi:MAG: peptidase M16, partial [Meiothermus sp.]
SRLFTEVREKRGLVYSVYASPNGVKGYSYLSAYAGTMPSRADETLRVLQGEIERLAEGVSEEELERAKIGLRTSLVMGEESARSRVGSITRDLYLIGRVRTLDEIEAEIAAVDTSRINRYLAESPYRNPWIGTLGPKALAMSDER